MNNRIESISYHLLQHIRVSYQTALSIVLKKGRLVDQINGYSEIAIPCYIIAVSCVEAFVNEMFISPVTRPFYKGSPPKEDWIVIEKKELCEKLDFLLKMYFGKTLEKGKQPFQSLQQLVKLRNELVHYKMDFKPPFSFIVFKNKRIFLRDQDISWVTAVSTLEGIRWAHNTVIDIIMEIAHFSKNETHPILPILTEMPFFSQIKKKEVEYWIRMHDKNI